MAESKFLIKFSNVNRSKYVYGSPVTTKQGYVECKCEYMRDNNKPAPFFFETPRLISATGIYNLDSKFYIDLLVPMASPFLDWLLAEDETNINATADNSESWFGERTSTDEIAQGYKTSLIFRSKGAEPVLRVNIPSTRGKPALEVFDNNKKLIDISAITPGCEVACIMEKMPLRFYQDKFTGEYLIYKLKVCSNSQVNKLPPGYIFSEQSDEEEELSSASEDADLTSGDENIQLDISGDEEESGEEDPLAVSGDEEESGEEYDPLAVSGDEEESGEEYDPLAVSGDEEESGEEYDPLAISGDEEESGEEDPLAVSGDEEESGEEDPLAVSGDEEESGEEDPLAVSGDEDESGEEEDPLAISGDEEEDPLAVSGDEEESGEEEDPLAVSGDEEEDPLAVSGDEEESGEEDPLAVSGDEDPLAISGDEFDISEGGTDEELVKKPKSLLAPEELTDSDLELSEF